MEFSDGQLVTEIKQGSAVAFERLMSRYERLVFKVAFGVTGERESALDITQNVFLKVHRKIATFRIEGDFRNWVARIAMNESINWTRSQRRHRTEELDEEYPPTSLPSQEDRVSRQELWDQVRRSLATLKPKHRTAVSLRYFEGMSIREIGAVLGCSDGVVKSILFRSVRKIKLRLESTAEVTT